MKLIIAAVLVLTLGTLSYAQQFPVPLPGQVWSARATFDAGSISVSPCGTQYFGLNIDFDFVHRAMRSQITCDNGFNYTTMMKCTANERSYVFEVCPPNDDACRCHEYLLSPDDCPSSRNIIYGNLTYLGEVSWNATVQAKLWGFSANDTSVKIWTDAEETAILKQDVTTMGNLVTMVYYQWSNQEPNARVFDIPSECAKAARTKLTRNVAHAALPAGRWLF